MITTDPIAGKCLGTLEKFIRVSSVSVKIELNEVLWGSTLRSNVEETTDHQNFVEKWASGYGGRRKWEYTISLRCQSK